MIFIQVEQHEQVNKSIFLTPQFHIVCHVDNFRQYFFFVWGDGNGFA